MTRAVEFDGHVEGFGVIGVVDETGGDGALAFCCAAGLHLVVSVPGVFGAQGWAHSVESSLQVTSFGGFEDGKDIIVVEVVDVRITTSWNSELLLLGLLETLRLAKSPRRLCQESITLWQVLLLRLECVLLRE